MVIEMELCFLCYLCFIVTLLIVVLEFSMSFVFCAMVTIFGTV